MSHNPRRRYKDVRHLFPMPDEPNTDYSPAFGEMIMKVDQIWWQIGQFLWQIEMSPHHSKLKL